MNKSQAQNLVGRNLRLRPVAIRLTDAGERLPQEDDFWLLERVDDSFLALKNLRTEHAWKLGVDNVREYRSPDFLLLRCQLTLKGAAVISEPFTSISVERNLAGFEILLKHSWLHEFIGEREFWISEIDSMFQIEKLPSTEEFHEEWTKRFPASNESRRFPVRLRVYGVDIKELTFIACDGGNVTMPMPEVRSGPDGTREFFYKRGSLSYRVGQIAGSFFTSQTLEEAARCVRIKIE